MTVSVRRTLDAGFLNAVANDPAVRPTLGNGDGPLDLSGVVEDAANIALVCDAGGFVLTPLSPGNLEVHSIFKPGTGGAVEAMRDAMEWVFTRTDCVSIWSKVPKSNRAAKGLALAGSLRSLFERDHETLGPTEFCEVPIMRWAMNCAALEREGERFHTMLEEAKRASGSTLPEHPHDAAHERAVGAALLMFERGLPMKGAGFYNTWANFAGYRPLGLLSVSPVVVDAGDAIFGLGSQGLEILKCQ